MISRTKLYDVHNSLSHIVFAVKKTLEPLWVDVKATWKEYTNLSIEIEVKEKNKQIVIDKLNHGVFIEDYDYRFRISYPTHIDDPEQWVTVSAYPDMKHDEEYVESRHNK